MAPYPKGVDAVVSPIIHFAKVPGGTVQKLLLIITKI